MELLETNRLSKDYINSLPIIRFQGKVEIINQKDHAERTLNSLMNEKLLGFDTESRPSFKKGIAYPVSIVQLATPYTAYLFQIGQIGLSAAMVSLLSSDTIKKIGIGIQQDIQKLQEYQNFSARGFIDLSDMADKKGIIQTGARGLAARYTAHRLVKSSRTTNWAMPVLTKKQLLYAATDAWICLEIYPRLKADKLDYRKFNEDEENLS